MRFVTGTWDRMWAFSCDADYEPDATDSLLARAGGDPDGAARLAYDQLLADDGRGIIYFPFLNYAAGSLDPLHELHRHPRTRMGLADGGAHCGTIADGGMPTFMLSYWTRDRGRARLDLPLVVHRQTQQTAGFYGLTDRGVVAPGYRADLNVIDYGSTSTSISRYETRRS